MAFNHKDDVMGPVTKHVQHPSHVIKWYRTKLPPGKMKELQEKSDLSGYLQTLSFLGMQAAWFGLALHFQAAERYGFAVFFTLLYGMQANFLINGMHELGHGTVFRTKFLNGFFMRIISFLGWLHPGEICSRRYIITQVVSLCQY